jgi:hypothetical protein
MTITSEALVAAGILFSLRVLNNAISTVRLIMLARNKQVLTFILRLKRWSPPASCSACAS